jgi:hypothetical protein
MTALGLGSMREDIDDNRAFVLTSRTLIPSCLQKGELAAPPHPWKMQTTVLVLVGKEGLHDGMAWCALVNSDTRSQCCGL